MRTTLGPGTTLVLAFLLASGLVAPRLASSAESEAERIARVVAPTTDFSKPEAFELRPGGATSSSNVSNRDAFSQHSANMAFDRQLDFRVGNGIFRKVWVSAPS